MSYITVEVTKLNAASPILGDKTNLKADVTKIVR